LAGAAGFATEPPGEALPPAWAMACPPAMSVTAQKNAKASCRRITPSPSCCIPACIHLLTDRMSSRAYSRQNNGQSASVGTEKHSIDRSQHLPYKRAMPATPPKIGFVSLGCPKALVDSERIITKLRAEGYELSPSYEGADAVVVNTCGFLNSAKEESLEAIGEALGKNGRVIVTGCLGVESDRIRARYPGVLAITGPHQYEAVVEEVHKAVPRPHDPFLDLLPPQGIKLTPRHYAYLKISEGCNNACSFCIIPSLRGDLKSRPLGEVMREAEKLVAAGVKELLVISQDTSAYGLDLRYAKRAWRGEERDTRFIALAGALGSLGAWVRLHYVYPYPHVDEVLPLMAEGRVLPYLDIPFQHASPSVLKAMRRPAHQEKTLERTAHWRDICPDLAIRSTFIVGFPGETEQDFELLLDWLEEAKLTRVGCFKYENVDGAAANALDGHVPEEVKAERYARLMQRQQAISADLLAGRVGKTIEVIVDEVDEEGTIARSHWDAPEIDGNVYLNGEKGLKAGNRLMVKVAGSDEYDLWADRVGSHAERETVGARA
jgi:ribosomal protein S12 methylthiotransferase